VWSFHIGAKFKIAVTDLRSRKCLLSVINQLNSVFFFKQ